MSSRYSPATRDRRPDRPAASSAANTVVISSGGAPSTSNVVRTQIEDRDLGVDVVRAVAVLDADDVGLLLAGDAKPTADGLVLGDAVEAVAHLRRLQDEQLLRLPVDLPVLEDLEEDLTSSRQSRGRCPRS